MNLDHLAAAAVQRSVNLAVPWWLTASYLHYVHHGDVLSDACYDWLARGMLSCAASITHRHARLITLDDLQAGSLFRLRAIDYPGRVRGAACQLVLDHWGTQLDERRGL